MGHVASSAAGAVFARNQANRATPINTLACVLCTVTVTSGPRQQLFSYMLYTNEISHNVLINVPIERK